MAVRLFVGNIPNFCEEADLNNEFLKYGDVVHVDLKQKSDENNQNNSSKFAFITLNTSHEQVNQCISNFQNHQWNGSKLYVTRARESFLERLKREREEAEAKKAAQKQKKLEKKRRNSSSSDSSAIKSKKIIKINKVITKVSEYSLNENQKPSSSIDKPIDLKNNDKFYKTNKRTDLTVNGESKDKKQMAADAKRLDSIKKMRQEFKEKKMLLQKGLATVDNKHNNRIVFSDDYDIQTNSTMNDNTNKNTSPKSNNKNKKLFDEYSDDDDKRIDFIVKEQFEGAKGQKLLELQSHYKSDSRFKLDERFMSDNEEEETTNLTEHGTGDHIDEVTIDEKSKQLNILQDVLGVQVKMPSGESDRKKKGAKLGMLRFDPTRPDHTKFLAETQQTENKKTKKEKKKEKLAKQEQKETAPAEENRPEVSKEVFYRVSSNLKEAISQPTQFSLRSLFGNKEITEEGEHENGESIAIEKVKKHKNPLDKTDKNPFVYDSSDTEDDESEAKQMNDVKEERKEALNENFFFSHSDKRFVEALEFFNKPSENVIKDRRELKFIMKKRLSNISRKEQMFKKKIGGGQRRNNVRGMKFKPRKR